MYIVEMECSFEELRNAWDCGTSHANQANHIIESELSFNLIFVINGFNFDFLSAFIATYTSSLVDSHISVASKISV